MGLILGFALSVMVQAVVPKAEMIRLLPDDSFRSVCTATGLGAASSSCSYAALARSIFRKGANFTSAMAFEFASTNLVIEVGIMLGWQFTLGEFVGGPLMIAVLWLLFRLFLSRRLIDAAKRQADRGLRGVMEEHAEMDAAMVAAGLIVELVFGLLGLVPDERNARVVEASTQLNYTTVLNVVFLILAAVLVWRFLRTGGPEMLKEMR